MPLNKCKRLMDTHVAEYAEFIVGILEAWVEPAQKDLLMNVRTERDLAILEKEIPVGKGKYSGAESASSAAEQHNS